MRRIVLFGAAGVFTLAASGCIFVASRKSGYEEVELTKAQAQYLSARVEMERINLEREKAGLPRVAMPCDEHAPNAPGEQPKP